MYPSAADGFIAVICAVLLAVVLNRGSLLVLLKGNDQLTEAERRKVAHGLRRELLAEFILFAPAPAILGVLLSPLILEFASVGFLVKLKAGIRASALLRMATSGAVGMVWYIFPYKIVRKLVRTTAVNIVKSVLSSIDEDDKN